jgi:hypothetical protein
MKKPELASAAIELATRQLELEPEGTFAAQMYATIAAACITLGDDNDAIEAYRQAIKYEHLIPQ